MKLAFLVLFSFFSIILIAGNNDIDKTKQAKEWLKNQPLTFIENKGQFTDSEGKPATNVLFRAYYGNCDIYITTEGISYVFVKYDKVKGKSIDTNDIRSKFGQKGMENKTASYYRLDMNLQGSSINKTQIIKELPGKQGVTNYFYPNCPDGIYGVQEYGKITIKNIYKGIDWVIYTNAGNKESPLKYDFVVQPQANYKDIKIKFLNAQSTRLTDNCTKLKIQTIAGTIEEGNLYSYVQNSTEKQAIKTNYTANTDSTLQFEIGAYDKTKTLVIDPLVWATYYGNIDSEFNSLCIDKQDNIYITGWITSTNLPLQQQLGSYWQATNAGGWDILIVKFNSSGVRQWATYYGGNYEDIARSICADSQGNIYITGQNNSQNFPTQQLAGAYWQQRGNLYGNSIFILKFNMQGIRQWATYYGGSEADDAYSICADNLDNVYITGVAYSSDFPTQQMAGAYYQLSNAGGNNHDAFILKFNNQGIRQWATCYSGNGYNCGRSLCTDSQNNIYITGYTNSADFPIQELPGAYNQLSSTEWPYDAFILKFNTQGIRQWATYYGGDDVDWASSICSDKQDNICVTGNTLSTNFPTQLLSGAYNQSNIAGSSDIFILKFNSQGLRLWATYYGGNSDDAAYSICTDSQNNIYVAGDTYSTNFPVQQLTGEYWQDINAGQADFFLLKFSSQCVRKWATYYGSEGWDWGYGIATDRQNSAYFIGTTSGSVNFYTKDYGNGAYYDGIWNGNSDFILKIMLCNNQKPTSVLTNINNICINDNGDITLTAIGGIGDTLKWYSDNLGINYIGKGTPLIIPSPTQSTTYYARWESLCDTSDCDSVKIVIIPTTLITTNPQICQGKTATIGIHNYTATGIYTDTLATIYGCDSIITTHLTVIQAIKTAQSPSICEGENFPFGSHIYTNTGIYTDTLATIFGCDSIITTNLSVIPAINSTKNPSICEGENFQVGINIYNTSGTYTDNLKAISGCDSIVTTTLTVNPLPFVSLGEDKLICKGDSIVLSPGPGFSSYLWSDGSVLSDLLVTHSGIYSVTAFNKWCPATDEISINECGAEIWFPNAFSPDNDGINESFKPVIMGTLSSYQILIYNRWGQELYESNDSYAGWDGKFQGSTCATGQYVYIVKFAIGTSPATLKQGIKRGLVTLIK